MLERGMDALAVEVAVDCGEPQCTGPGPQLAATIKTVPGQSSPDLARKGTEYKVRIVLDDL